MPSRCLEIPMRFLAPFLCLSLMAPGILAAGAECANVNACLKEADRALAKGDNGTACAVLFHASTLIAESENKALKEEVASKAANACIARLDESIGTMARSLKEKVSALSALFSGEPTNEEVTQAVLGYERQALAQRAERDPAAGFVTGLLMMSSDFKIARIEKLSCQSAGSKAYVCYVEQESSNTLTGTEKTVAKYLFLKNADGWFAKERQE